MSNQTPNPKLKSYNLKDRTRRFGKDIIRFTMSLPQTNIYQPLLNQVIRSATSIGANYMEADGAFSKKDFRHKIALCRKEAKETMHWLDMISVVCPDKTEPYRKYWKEAYELVLIFSAILKPNSRQESI